jgi:uncharacterized protein YcbK (DUF882 family)
MKYFTLKELTKSATASRLKIDNTPDANVIQNLNALVNNILDPLREAYGKPIIVSSGYRCPKLNKAVGGVPTSQHMLGQAADIHTVSDSVEDNKKLYELIRKLDLPVDQCINEYNYNWIHVSYGPRNRRRYFNIN